MQATRRGNTTWVAEVIGSWVAAYRCVRQSGDYVVAEIRVFPRGQTEELGDAALEGLWAGSGSDTPVGGIPARVLRELRPGAAARFARGQGEARRRSVHIDPNAAQSGLLEYPPYTLTREQRLARAAVNYVSAIHKGSRHPNEDVAAAMGVSTAKVTEDLRAARRAGLLTPTRRGVGGGDITERCEEILSGMLEQFAIGIILAAGGAMLLLFEEQGNPPLADAVIFASDSGRARWRELMRPAFAELQLEWARPTLWLYLDPPTDRALLAIETDYLAEDCEPEQPDLNDAERWSMHPLSIAVRPRPQA